MAKFNGLPEPHGGVLINRLANVQEKDEWVRRSRELPKIPASAVTVANIEMIAIGGYSPITGFMERQAYWSVVYDMKLPNGLVWSIPIVLPIPEDFIKDVKRSELAAICDGGFKDVYAVIKVSDIFKRDKGIEAKEVYGTKDLSHPGVERIYSEPEWLVGGEIIAIKLPEHHPSIKAHYLTPKETRSVFISRGYRRVVGFQTRNPLHRAHEYIVKCALETVDGLLLHPLVGPTKSDDIPSEVRMRCYEVLIEKYFPKERVVLAVNPSPMWYAGPREAIFHAIVRKNYGCTHFIIGRDHAGVGNFYDPFAAHRIFDQFTLDEIGIVPIFFDDSFYCSKCENMATSKVCPHGVEDRVYFSGTKVRNQLKMGELPPPEITRPEVAQILIEFYRSLGG